MYCRHGSQCLLAALTRQNVRDIPCRQIRKSVDILAETVLDCEARDVVYQCVQTSLPYVISRCCGCALNFGRLKLAFHDADTDTGILARILAKNSACRT